VTNVVNLKRFVCDVCARRFKTAAALSDHQRDAHDIAIPHVIIPEPEADPCCMECGKVARLVKGDAIYPHRADLFARNFWLCECGAYCGCHGVTTRPLGFPCGAETRHARKNAHEVFDPIWRSGMMRRAAAYAWLAGQLGITREECHIGMMTAHQARQTMLVARSFRFAGRERARR
jgi:hypothetical protein